MTLDEAITHTEDVAKEQDKLCKRYDDASGYSRSHNDDIRTYDAKKCEKCAEDHRQLAGWLRDYKRLLGAIEDIKAEINKLDDLNPDYPMDMTVHLSKWEVLQIIDKYTSGKEQE